MRHADDAFSAAETARAVLRAAETGGLATLAANGAPFASLVLVATTSAGEPLLLLSGLAVHTKNLTRDPRVSLLLVASGGEGGEGGDPLAGVRISVSGAAAADADAESRRRFLTHHPEAAAYADFGDFRFYRLVIADAHLVAGFGRIVDLGRDDLVLDGAQK
jgi:putative heme iron utilization protein